MLKYETLILARTQITADELSMIESYFENLLSDAKGKVLAFDKWGKYRLAYPVKKNDYGIYILIRYEMPEQAVTSAFKKLSEFFKIKCNEIVMRNASVKLNKDASSIYKYPESVDVGRAGGLDTFIKENKMEGFLDDVKPSSTVEDKKDSTKEEVSSEKEVEQN